MQLLRRVCRADAASPASLATRWQETLYDPTSWHTIAGFALLSSLAIGARRIADLGPGNLAGDWLLLESARSKIPMVALGVVAVALAGRHVRLRMP